MRKHLQLLEHRDPQFDINGMRNTWIAKPNCTYITIQFYPEAEESAVSTTSMT